MKKRELKVKKLLKKQVKSFIFLFIYLFWRRKRTQKKKKESKREKIEEHLQSIEQRLTELQEEKDEFQNFQKFDKERRFLEHTIYDREYAEINNKLKEVSLFFSWEFYFQIVFHFFFLKDWRFTSIWDSKIKRKS